MIDCLGGNICVSNLKLLEDMITYEGMSSFVLVALKVEIMLNGMILVRPREDNIHEEFTPSLLVNAERRLSDNYNFIKSASYFKHACSRFV